MFKTSKMTREVVGICLLSAVLGLAGAASAVDINTSTKRYVVTFKSGSADSVKAAVLAARGNVKQEIADMNAMAIEASPLALISLRKNPNVASVEEDVKRYPFATTTSSSFPYLSGQQVPYGIKMVQADQLQLQAMLNSAMNVPATDRKICIIDSGYDRTHEDLSTSDVTGEYDSGTGWWYTDESGHGTHVAGAIAAINNSGVGVVGVDSNRKLKLHIVKVFGADGWTYSSTLAAAAGKCSLAGANVISMSLGGSDSSILELATFQKLQRNGILIIAAAGNGGNTEISYPAGYDSVMSVAALDENKQQASFSQYNSDVEIAGPGVDVLSTVPMGTGTSASLSVGGVSYTVNSMVGSSKTSATAPLADFGIGDQVNSAVSGKVCLIARGTVDFATKVANCQSSGGVGAIVYNNVAGTFSGSLGTTVAGIPSVSASDTDGAAMKNQLGQSATVAVTATNYAYYNGTSMATPHVSAVAALVWSYFPTCTATQIRNTLNKSAEDLGEAGRDTRYGYGLVRAQDAYNRLKAFGCNN